MGDAWISARIEPDTAQWLMDIGVLHYGDHGWVVERDIWRSPTDEEIAQNANCSEPTQRMARIMGCEFAPKSQR